MTEPVRAGAAADTSGVQERQAPPGKVRVEAAAEERRVAVIDDDEVIRLSCERILRKTGYQVQTFGTGREGLEHIERHPPPVALIDLKMPGLNGFQVIQRVREMDADVVLLVITGYATIATAVEAMKAGAYDFLPKPFTPDELRLIVDRGFERWRLAAESRRLRHQMELAERRFLAFVSHQLKSPLVAVKQYLDVLSFQGDAGLPDQAREWLARCRERLDEMFALIQDWLALSRVECGQLAVRECTTDLAVAADHVIREHGAQAAAARVRVETRFPSRLPAVTGDETCLRTLLSNLLSNAVKYNRPGGTVLLSARQEADEVVLEVKDTGIGMPADVLSRIFDEFYRAPGPATEGVPGTGLGLTLCRRIAGELGGSITVESREGEGSTFVVRLPLPRSPDGPEGEAGS